MTFQLKVEVRRGKQVLIFLSLFVSDVRTEFDKQSEFAAYQRGCFPPLQSHCLRFFFLHQVCVYIKMLCSTTSVWVHIRIHINLLLCRLLHYLMGFRFPGNCYLRQLRPCAVNANVTVHLYFQHTEAGKTVRLSKQISSETMFFSSTIFSCVWQASDSSNPNSFLLDFTSFPCLKVNQLVLEREFD